jgi:predicted AlkP superfamily phosphohydrolase/phosphomutase
LVKILIIGIDGLEPTFVKRLIESGKSRGFSFFFESGLHAPLKSTFPPDTLLEWPQFTQGYYHIGLIYNPNPRPLLLLDLKVSASETS